MSVQLTVLCSSRDTLKGRVSLTRLSTLAYSRGQGIEASQRCPHLAHQWATHWPSSVRSQAGAETAAWPPGGNPHRSPGALGVLASAWALGQLPATPKASHFEYAICSKGASSGRNLRKSWHRNTAAGVPPQSIAQMQLASSCPSHIGMRVAPLVQPSAQGALQHFA